jgi:tRNA pseudouridine55 synthase
LPALLLHSVMEKPSINSFTSLEELLQGCVCVIDKPLDWTSFDVVGKMKGRIRRQTNGAKVKIGHAGTLDPLASGVLVVCTGKFTKSIEQFMSGLKEYTGTITMGQTTPSFDLETAPEGDFPFQHFSEQDYIANAALFVGEQMQTPPIYSAKQIDGKRAYEMARKGEEVKMRTVLIEVMAFDVTRVEHNKIDFRIVCSKGTYIRSLANDFGARMGSGSYLSSLRRTGSFPFTDADCISVDDFIAKLEAAPEKITS